MTGFSIEEAGLPGCYLVFPDVRVDHRGRFVKTYRFSVFTEGDLVTDFREEYYSVSHRGVLRGLHFQIPPGEHGKLVSCLRGEAVDAVVDLRVGSPTFGRHFLTTINPERSAMVYVPVGCAHGFLAREEDTVLCYKVTSEYDPECDKGIKWDSASVPWGIEAPILSERDSSFPALADFESPFIFSEV